MQKGPDHNHLGGKAPLTRRPSRSRAQEQARSVTALDKVLRVRQTIPGRGVDLPATAAGSWDTAHQLLVADRRDTD